MCPGPAKFISQGGPAENHVIPPEHGVATLVAGKAIPLVYVREGGSVFIGGASRGGNEEWFRQVMLSGSALLDLNGKRVRMRATLVSDPDERRVVEGLFRACFPDRFSMWFSERTKWVAMSEGARVRVVTSLGQGRVRCHSLGL